MPATPNAKKPNTKTPSPRSQGDARNSAPRKAPKRKPKPPAVEPNYTPLITDNLTNEQLLAMLEAVENSPDTVTTTGAEQLALADAEYIDDEYSDEASQSWIQIKGEPDKWYARFQEYYLLLGTGRSLRRSYINFLLANKGQEAVADETRIHVSSGWIAIARKWDWHKRAIDWDKMKTRELEAEWDERRRQVREQDWNTSQALRSIGLEIIKRAENFTTTKTTVIPAKYTEDARGNKRQVAPEQTIVRVGINASTGLKALMEGSKLSRLATEMSNGRIDVNHDLKNLTDEQLLERLGAELGTGKDKSPAAPLPTP